jgi:predicted dehydrogenase
MKAAVVGAQHGHVLGLTRKILCEPGVELVAVAEAEPSVRQDVANVFRVPAIEDYRELLDGSIDAAIVGPINAEKGRVIATCLDAGVHVLVDKPAVITHDDLDMVERAAKGRTQLSCALTERYSAPYRAAKLAIDAGEIGEIVSSVSHRPHKCRPASRPAWFFDRNLNGGAILDLCIHDIDVVRWLHGQEPVAVAAAHGNARFSKYPDFIDHAEVWIRFEAGGCAFVRGSWLTPEEAPYHGDCQMWIEGTKGSIQIRTSAELSCTIDTGGTSKRLTEFSDQTDLRTRSRPNGVASDFCAAVRGETNLVTSCADVIASHRWALLARDAADNGTFMMERPR